MEREEGREEKKGESRKLKGEEGDGGKQNGEKIN